MFTEYAYYDLKIVEAKIKESQVSGRAFVSIAWEDKVSGKRIFDTVPGLHTYKIQYYKMEHLVNTQNVITDADIQYLVGKEDRLKVLYTTFKDRKFPLLDIKSAVVYSI